MRVGFTLGGSKMDVIDKVARDHPGLTSPLRLTLIFLALVLITVAVVLASLIVWEREKAQEALISEMKVVSSAFFDQIMVARTWNALHGGVYAEQTSETQPNPYLDEPGRDIMTTDGKRLTKINHAYMTRQMSEIAAVNRGYKFRVVSLKPVNPSFSADPWEANTLTAIERSNSPEGFVIDRDHEGNRIFRYLKPLFTEQACLKCHEWQGYKQGDVRGAVSISVPMAHYDSVHAAEVRRTVVSLVSISGAGFLLLSVVTLYLGRRLSSEIEKNVERRKLVAVVELAGAAAHELRQPMTVVHNLLSLFKEKVRHQENVTEEELKIIDAQCVRMNGTLDKMLNITSYKTKPYVGNERIVDLEKSAESKDS
jgi:hypothetical protein